MTASPLVPCSRQVYGGTPIAELIANLKRGAEIVVATPGRLIDILTANSGRPKRSMLQVPVLCSLYPSSDPTRRLWSQ